MFYISSQGSGGNVAQSHHKLLFWGSGEEAGGPWTVWATVLTEARLDALQARLPPPQSPLVAVTGSTFPSPHSLPASGCSRKWTK